MKRGTIVLSILLATLLVLSVGPASAAKKKKKGRASGPGGAAGAAVVHGNILLGGDLNFGLGTGKSTIEPDGGKEADTDLFEFGIDALGGYFIMRSLEIGGLLLVEYESEENDSAKTTETTWAIAPQVGYFFPVTSEISLFGLLPIGYMKVTEKTEPDAVGAKDTETTYGGLMLEPRAGAVYHLNKTIGISAALFLRYFSGSGENDNGTSTTDFDAKQTMFGLKVGIFGFL